MVSNDRIIQTGNTGTVEVGDTDSKDPSEEVFVKAFPVRKT
jgi:hypothetical protein